MNIAEKLNNTQIYVFANLASNEADRDATAMDIISMIYQHPQRDAIEKARHTGKGTDLYDKTKRYEVPSVRWAFSDPLRSLNPEVSDKLDDPTGLMYVDFDPEDLQGLIDPDSTLETSEALKALFNLPYVLAVWRSFGGHGLGVICAVNGYTFKTHAEHYYDLTANIFQHTGLMADLSCSDPMRLNVVSSDEKILLKSGDCTPYALRTYNSNFSDPSNNVFKQFNSDPESDSITEHALDSSGWKQSGGDYWVRPGKQKGVSAIFSKSGIYAGKIRVFTSSTDLEPKMYDKSELVKDLLYSGNGKEFFKYLAKRYPSKGERSVRQPSTPLPTEPTRGNGYAMPEDPDEIDKLIDTLEIEGKVEIVDMMQDFGGFAVYPPALEEALETYTENSGLPREFIMHASLFAISTLTQGKIELNVNPEFNYKESPVFWGMTIGRPGEGKTPPHKVLLSPIIDKIQEKLNTEYEQANEDYNNWLSLSQKEKNELGENAEQFAKPPQRKQVLATEGTLEGLIQVLRDSGSTGYYVDEIDGFFSSMNAYRGGAGADSQTYLQIFNRSTIQKNLVRENLYIKKPFMPITGTGTPKKILKVLRQNHAENGMYERFTYFLTPKQDTENVEPKKVNSRRNQQEGKKFETENALFTWEQFVNKTFTFFNNIRRDSPIQLNYDDEAIDLLEKWEQYYNDEEAKYLRDNKESRASLVAKMRTYFYRLPIIFWVARNLGANPKGAINYNDMQHPTITIEDISSATSLMRYLHSTWEYVHDELFNVTDPNTLDASGLSLYRKGLVLKLYKKNKDIGFRKIAEAVNRLTPGHKPLAHTTAMRWVRV